MPKSYPLSELQQKLEAARGQADPEKPATLPIKLRASTQSHYRLDKLAAHYGYSSSRLARLLLESAIDTFFNESHFHMMYTDDSEEESYLHSADVVRYYKQRMKSERALWLATAFLDLPDQK